MIFDDILLNGSGKMNIDISSAQLDMVKQYSSLLLAWNEKINLTAITSPEEIATKHFLDSFTPLTTGYIPSDASVIDVGTGAGFPGLPMKIASSGIKLTLLDSLNKRINFLKTVIDELSLTDTECVHSRAEDAGHDKKFRESFDVAVSRAVANMSSLAELCLPFVKVGGVFMALKGPMADEELSKASNAIQTLGGRLEKVVSVQIPFSDLSHKIVVIKKDRHTPTQYPRKAPAPTKTPIN